MVPLQEAVWIAIPHVAHRVSYKQTVIKASVNNGPWKHMRTRDAAVQDHQVRLLPVMDPEVELK